MSLLKYLFFRLCTFPLAFLPYKTLHTMGNALGLIAYYLYPKYRKRALTNLALASDLKISPLEIEEIAKASLKSLSITFLEYPKLSYEKDISKIATCENPLKYEGGVIFFCGHQANWELLFLEGTSRMSGVAIGRPIKNKYLYNWVISIREKFGGKIIPPQKAFKEGVRALQQGAFVGIVGDQGMPNSGFSCPFLGRRAWTSPLPALLSLRTGAPIVVATIRREKGHYFIHYSDPVFPENESVESLMHKTLALFEESIKKNLSQWMWIHNRWKQQLPGKLPSRLRHESIALIFDTPDIKFLDEFREFYPTEFITAYIPETLALERSGIDVKPYKSLSDLLVSQDRFKLVFNFTKDKRLSKHFRKQGAFNVINLPPKEILCRLRDFTSTRRLQRQ